MLPISLTPSNLERPPLRPQHRIYVAPRTLHPNPNRDPRVVARSHIMAIYSAVPPPEDALPASSQTPPPASYHAAAAAAAVDIDIDAWTVSALQSLSISPVARGIGSPLTIPIDELHAPASRKPAAAGAALRAGVSFTEEGIAAAVSAAPGRPPSRRDSQRKREAVLKGKEGSRQRRRWENGTSG